MVRGAFVGIGVSVQLEAISGLEAAPLVVAGQAWKGNATDRGGGTVAIFGVVWLGADVGVRWDGNTGGGGWGS